MAALLRGRTLKDALDMDTQEQTKIERDFLRESELARLFEQQQEIDRIQAQAEARRQQVEADRQRDLAEAERQLAEERAQAERQRAEERAQAAKRYKRLSRILAFVLFIALAASLLALYSFFDANRQRIVAEEQSLLAHNAQGTAVSAFVVAQTAVVQRRAAETTALAARQIVDSVRGNNAERAAQLATANAIQVAALQ